MRPKKVLSIGILNVFLFFSAGCVPAFESAPDTAQPETETESESASADALSNRDADTNSNIGSSVNAGMGSSMNADIVFSGWGDFPIVFSGGDETIDFGMSVAEVASRLGKISYPAARGGESDPARFKIIGMRSSFYVTPESDVFCAGWKVAEERYVFSEENVLFFINTKLRFVGEKERPDAFLSMLEQALGPPAYAGGVKWDGERKEWTEFSTGIDDADIPVYFESEWEKDGDKVLSYRQFGSRATVCQAVSEYPSDDILADLLESVPGGVYGIEYPADRRPAPGRMLGLIDEDTELRIGDFVLGMDEAAFWKVLGKDLVSEQPDAPARDWITKRECLFSGGRAIFVDQAGQSSTLYSITVETPKYQTYRGLSPLDTVLRLVELYGFPFYSAGDTWSYGIGGYEYYLFTVRRGVVLTINLHHWSI
jgi:hypothetical protein